MAIEKEVSVQYIWDYRRSAVLLVLCIIVFSLIGLTVYKSEWLVDSGPAPNDQEHPAVIKQPLIPSEWDKLRSWFGPWKLVAAGQSANSALVLIRASGGMEESSWTVKVDKTWLPTDVPQIDQVSSTDKVEFTTGGLATYKVAYGQPFVLEQVPNRVFAFLQDGGRLKIVATTPEIVKQLGRKL